MVKIVFALFVSVLGTAILLDNIGDEEQIEGKRLKRNIMVSMLGEIVSLPFKVSASLKNI